MSGLRDGADMSMDEPQLPGVLPDLAGLAELTLARGSFKVVTDPAGSCPRDNMLAAVSAVAKLGGRASCLVAELEKKRGDRAPSPRRLLEDAGTTAGRFPEGNSTLRGGEAPVRAFLTGEVSMALPGLTCLDDRFAGV